MKMKKILMKLNKNYQKLKNQNMINNKKLNKLKKQLKMH